MIKSLAILRSTTFFHLRQKMQLTTSEIHLSEFDNSLKLLAKNHQLKLEKLSPELKEAYQKVKNVVLTFHGTPAYAIVKQSIAKLVKPNKIEHGTVASYIWGCVHECYGDAEKYCTPLCINSIPLETNENPSCQHHIITRELTDDERIDITCLNCNKENEYIHTAILYSNEDIDSLTGQEIRFIKNLGISQLAIMIRDGFKYHLKMKMTPIDRIDSKAPDTMIPKGFIQSPLHIKEEKDEERHSNDYKSWFFIILLIIILALLVYFFL